MTGFGNRGYYYDTDTGFYYLQSRYYDPEICRFINADNISTILSTPGELTDFNLYAYCDNNPVMRTDENGESWFAYSVLIGCFVNGGISAISQYITTGEVNLGVVIANVVAGGIAGALAATNISLMGSIGINAVLGGGTYVAEQIIKGEDITPGGVAASAFAGGVSGFIGGKGTNVKGLEATWKTANNRIIRESRRANLKYAEKQIVKYNAKKIKVISTIAVAISRFTLGTVANTCTRSALGY